MPEPAPIAWLLYDASCGICSRAVPAWDADLQRLGVATAAIQEPWVAERVRLDADALLRDISLLFADGTLLRGADAYRWILRRRWWGWPLWCLAVVPPGRWLFNAGYRLIARHRHRISQVCGLEPPPR